METIPQEAPIQSWGWMIGDESGIVEQIEITHFPDGREINAHSILSIITHILKDCAIDDPSPEEDSKDEAETVDEEVQHEIHKLSPKVAYLSSEIGDVHEKTVDVFNMLSNYQWEAKLTLALAAIVTNYGEYWVVAQSNNPHKELTKMMKFLRQMGENPADQKSHFHALHALFQSMLDIIKAIFKIKDFMLQSSHYETTISLATTITVIASYWTVRSILISAPYIHSLFAKDYEPSASASKERELRILTRKLGALLMCLQNHEEKSLEKQQCIAEEKRYREMMCAFEEDHADNMRNLKLLFKSKGNNNNDDLAPIVDCSNNQRVELESLKNKNVVLMLSSGIDISKRMLHNLAQIWNDILVHNSSCEGHGDDECKLIWFPISNNWDDPMQHKFEELRSKMPFYSTTDPRCIHPTTIKFIRHKFGFKRESILVVMDGVGKILYHNAFHELWMWTAMARSFITENPSSKLAPFPLSVELLQQYYWKTHHWSLTDLFLGIDDKTIELISKTKHAWIIGGDNMELVKRLETNINAVDQTYETISGIVYMGKSSSCRGKDRNNNVTWEMSGNKQVEYRHSWEDDEKKTWLFWARVESMLLSRLHFLRRLSSGHDDENEDEAAKTLKKLLSYNNNPQTWAIFCCVKKDNSGEWKNEYYYGIEDGLIMLDAVSKFQGEWEECCKFLQANSSHALGRSQRVQFYTQTLQGSIIKCPDCYADMEKYTVLSCCHHL
ncbi:PREDICTED: protein SIEVE ELEMENT OCCLUSION B-like [Ipomoea nil]|uniref:protein SIEVE ELEMENT OCCLUSION B-like n=1 Tax=Ipomoea nil TaxID=35883 RepID=UPI0009018EC0|nr:PREDICTED: protein SIEVE ELEMENT OCCLUSION B-like [Ipomoea nil]